MKTVSLRRRVTLASLGVLALALIAFDVFLYVSFDQRLTGDLQRQLQERAGLASSLASSLAPQELADRLATGGITAQVTKGGQRYVARPPAPPPPGGRGKPRASGFPRPARGHGQRSSLRKSESAGPHRIAAAPTSHGPAPGAPGIAAVPTPPAPAAVRPSKALRISQPLGGGEQLVLYADRSPVDHDLAGLLVLEIAGTLAVLGLVAVALAWILGRALSPLDRTTAVAGAIARGQARERLAPQRADTELGRMAAAFDAMLDRLETALDAARASEARMRQFLSDAAHELRTPIAGVQASAETLLREHADQDLGEQLAVQMIRDSARAGRLVGDLLALSRLDDNPELELAELDLAALAREQLAHTQVLAPTVQMRYEGPLRYPIQADRDRIIQVIVNLLDNARHATPDGGSITLAITDADFGPIVSISDTGPGIPAADRGRIFERFVRLDPARSRDRFGSGLGLPIARRIAQAHGGDLRCADTRDGARFELSLPRYPPRGSSRQSDGHLSIPDVDDRRQSAGADRS